MSSLEARVTKQMADFTKALEKIRSTIPAGQSGSSSFTALGLLELAFNSFKELVTRELRDVQAALKTQELRSDALESYSRRNCLLLFGVPEVSGTSESECEKAALEIFSTKLGVVVEPGQVERAHRLGKPREKPRPIIVKFVSYKTRMQVFLEKKKLKGSPYMVGESLTKLRLAVLNKARDHFGLNKCWSSDGKVLAQYTGLDGDKRYVFTCMEQLDAVIEQLKLKPVSTKKVYPLRSREVK